MYIDRAQLEGEMFSLLKSWCDGLVANQLMMPGRDEYDGAILCPSCTTVHGRCPDAIYPLMYMADRTGEEKYLAAAKKLFKWGENLLTDDGSVYNDAQSDWCAITVFSAVSLHDALTRHGSLLDRETYARWEERLYGMAEWLHTRLVIGMSTNINYFATNACAMALLGKYFKRDDYSLLAKTLLAFCLEHLSGNLLLFGEGKPLDARTVKGCRAIDVGGYNVEESLPSLCRCAMELGDETAFKTLVASYKQHLEWMLPDGAWDNSVGTRTFKWTYWGSRTSDGCQEILFRLGREEPVFAEAALRNMRLYERCTHGGLLHGGLDYFRHGEKPCIHHTFCHAKALAGALDEGLYGFERRALPCDTFKGMRYYPELDTLRVSVGPWRADITAYDFDYMTGGHASGGAISLLWHERCGAVIASGAVDYSLHEIHNQQLSLKKAEHKSGCPRIELSENGRRFAQHYDYAASISPREAGEAVIARVSAFLCDNRYNRYGGDSACELEYAFCGDCVRISGRVKKEIATRAEYILPIVSDRAIVRVETGELAGEPEPMFNLNPGFMGREFHIKPDADGKLEVVIEAAGE